MRDRRQQEKDGDRPPEYRPSTFANSGSMFCPVGPVGQNDVPPLLFSRGLGRPRPRGRLGPRQTAARRRREWLDAAEPMCRCRRRALAPADRMSRFSMLRPPHRQLRTRPPTALGRSFGDPRPRSRPRTGAPLLVPPPRQTTTGCQRSRAPLRLQSALGGGLMVPQCGWCPQQDQP